MKVNKQNYVLEYLTEKQRRTFLKLKTYRTAYVYSFLYDYFKEGKCYTTLSGSQYKKQVCNKVMLRFLLDTLCQSYYTGNDAPRGGAMGNYIKQSFPRKVLTEKV